MRNKTETLLLFGLIFIPFFEFFVYVFMSSGKIPEFIDFRITKEYLSLGLALILTASIWRNGMKISCPNKWALFFLVFLFFNYSKTPIGVINPIVDVSLLGKYSPEFKVFAFFLMFCSIASYRFSQETIDRILKTILIGSAIMGAYMILQACNLDQILKTKTEFLSPTAVKGIKVCGFFGHPTLAVPYLVMSIPIAIYFKKFILAALIGIAAVLTGSDFSFASLGFIALLYSIGKKRFVPLLVLSAVAVSVLLIYRPFNFFNANGRIETWTFILKDVFSGEISGVPARIGLFGAGLDSFGSLFTALHVSAYTHAHNEFLEVLWTCGVVGASIFTMIHYDMIKTALLRIGDQRVKTILFSLSVIILCSMGTFVYQLGVYQFYVITFAGLIYQMQMKEEVSA